MSSYRFTTAALAAALLTTPSIADSNTHNINIAGKDTAVNVYGTLRVDGTYDADSKYLKETILDMVTSGKKDQRANILDLNIVKTRLGVTSVTPDTQFGDIKTKIEFNLDGHSDDRGEAKLAVKLNKAFINFNDCLTVGRTESTFIDPDASPEVLSPSSPIGQPNQDTGNINLVRYSTLFAKNIKLDFAIENNLSKNKPSEYKDASDQSGKSKQYSYNLYKADYRQCPTIVIAATKSNKLGHVSIRALQKHLSYHDDGDNHTHSKVVHAAQLSGNINIGQDKLLGTLYHGKSMGVYGNNLEDEIMVTKTDHTLLCNAQTGWQIGYTHKWHDKMRSTIAVSGVNVAYSDDITKAFEPNTIHIKNAQDYILNTMVTLSKNFEYGIEYVYEKAKKRIGTNVTAEPSIESHKVGFAIMAHF